MQGLAGVALQVGLGGMRIHRCWGCCTFILLEGLLDAEQSSVSSGAPAACSVTAPLCIAMNSNMDSIQTKQKKHIKITSDDQSGLSLILVGLAGGQINANRRTTSVQITRFHVLAIG